MDAPPPSRAATDELAPDFARSSYRPHCTCQPRCRCPLRGPDDGRPRSRPLYECRRRMGRRFVRDRTPHRKHPARPSGTGWAALPPPPGAGLPLSEFRRPDPHVHGRPASRSLPVNPVWRPSLPPIRRIESGADVVLSSPGSNRSRRWGPPGGPTPHLPAPQTRPTVRRGKHRPRVFRPLRPQCARTVAELYVRCGGGRPCGPDPHPDSHCWLPLPPPVEWLPWTNQSWR